MEKLYLIEAWKHRRVGFFIFVVLLAGYVTNDWLFGAQRKFGGILAILGLALVATTLRQWDNPTLVRNMMRYFPHVISARILFDMYLSCSFSLKTFTLCEGTDAVTNT